MANFDEFLTAEGMIDGNKVTPSTMTSNGVVNVGEGLRINKVGELSTNTAAIVNEVIANVESISNADIDAIF